MKKKSIIAIFLVLLVFLILPVYITLWSISTTSKLESDLLTLQSEISELKDGSGGSSTEQSKNYSDKLRAANKAIKLVAENKEDPIDEECVENASDQPPGILEKALDESIKNLQKTTCKGLNTANRAVVVSMVFVEAIRAGLGKVTHEITELRQTVSQFLIVSYIALTIFSIGFFISSVLSFLKDISELSENSTLREFISKVYSFFDK